MKVYISFTHNFQKLEIAQMAKIWRIYKEIMVYNTIEYCSTIVRKKLFIPATTYIHLKALSAACWTQHAAYCMIQRFLCRSGKDKTINADIR